MMIKIENFLKLDWKVYIQFISFFFNIFFKLYFLSLDLLTSFINLIACPNDLLRSQGAMLKYIHIIASDLMQVYDPIKLR